MILTDRLLWWRYLRVWICLIYPCFLLPLLALVNFIVKPLWVDLESNLDDWFLILAQYIPQKYSWFIRFFNWSARMNNSRHQRSIMWLRLLPLEFLFCISNDYIIKFCFIFWSNLSFEISDTHAVVGPNLENLKGQRTINCNNSTIGMLKHVMLHTQSSRSRKYESWAQIKGNITFPLSL